MNSVRGLGDNPRDPDRPVRRVTEATVEERERYAADAGGALVFPARVEERRPDGMLVLAYDGGGQGLERPEHVQPRLVMPWKSDGRADAPDAASECRARQGRYRGPAGAVVVRGELTAGALRKASEWLRPVATRWDRGGADA